MLWQSGQGNPDVVLIATGSEVSLALDAGKALAAECNVRVVSMPSWELFDRQAESYRQEIIPPQTRLKVVIEAGVAMGWEKYAGHDGLMLCMKGFGASAPYKALAEKFGFTTEKVVAEVRARLKK
jgi:transketolase